MVILVTVVTVLTAVFGEIGYSVRDELVAKGRTGEGLFLALALSVVGIASVVAAQVAAYAVLAYGAPGRAPVHMFLAWLLFTLIGTVLSSWDSVAGWAMGSLLGAAYALVGLGIGVGLRRRWGEGWSTPGLPAKRLGDLRRAGVSADRGGCVGNGSTRWRPSRGPMLRPTRTVPRASSSGDRVLRYPGWR